MPSGRHVSAKGFCTHQSAMAVFQEECSGKVLGAKIETEARGLRERRYLSKFTNGGPASPNENVETNCSRLLTRVA